MTGGIPSGSWTVVDLTSLGFTTSNDGATNATALTTAISTYNNTDTVLYIPNGTYAMAGVSVPRANRVAIRGQDMFQTQISVTSGEAAITWGADPGYGDAAFNPTGTVTSGFTRGSTTIVVQDNGNGASFRANEFLYCKVGNDASIPVITYRTYTSGLLDHMNFVTAVTDNGGGSWTLTLYRPVGYDYTGTVVVDQPQIAGLTGSRKVGIENLTIDCNSVVSRDGILFQTSMVDSWIKNVRVINADNYPIAIFKAVMCSIVGNFAAESIGWGSSHAGIAIYENCNGVLVEDNIVVKNAAGIIVQTSTNCAISHNLILDSATPITTNHAAFPHHNAYEGNIASFVSTDGFHGGSGTSVIHRNWFMATVPPSTGESAWVSTWNTTTGLPTNHSVSFGATLKRWTYKYAILRNVFGVPGYTEPNQGVLSLNGQPNMGNGYSYGYGTYGGALSTLASRTGDSEGVITAPADHGITTGSTIDVYWGTLLEGYPESFLRRGMTVGTVSGTSIPVSGGIGDALPAAAAEVYVPTANAAIRTYPRDWDGPNWRPQRWTAVVDSVDIPNSIVATITEGDVSVAQARVAEGIANYFWFTNVGPFNFGRQILTASPLSGAVITFDYDLAGWGEGNYPTVGQTLLLDCDSWGNQHLDLDVKRTAIVRGNKTYAGTAVKDALGVDETTPSSYIYGESAPGFLAGYSFPVFDTDSVGTLSVRRLPAGDRYMTFLETGSFESGGGGGSAPPSFSKRPGSSTTSRRR